MKKTLLALSLIGCLLLSSVSCTFPMGMELEQLIHWLTQETTNGSGGDSSDLDDSGAQNDQDDSGAQNDQDDSGSQNDPDDSGKEAGISNGGANTEEGWGALHPIH